jgi:hypothetical protein
MNSCPVCEAPAVARVCEVCGHAFAAATVADVEVLPLEDLDVPPTAGREPGTVPLADLEPTRFAPAASPADGSEVEFERTSIGRVADVAAGGLPELDRGRDETPSEPTAPAPSSVTCRYCRHVQASGLLCEDCGMRLPWNRRAAPAPQALLDVDALVRCQRCGERTYQRERCSSCGGVLAILE